MLMRQMWKQTADAPSPFEASVSCSPGSRRSSRSQVVFLDSEYQSQRQSHHLKGVLNTFFRTLYDGEPSSRYSQSKPEVQTLPTTPTNVKTNTMTTPQRLLTLERVQTIMATSYSSMGAWWIPLPYSTTIIHTDASQVPHPSSFSHRSELQCTLRHGQSNHRAHHEMLRSPGYDMWTTTRRIAYE